MGPDFRKKCQNLNPYMYDVTLFSIFFLNSSLTDTIWLLGKKTNGNWYWADGTSWTYTNWANGRPNAGTRHSSYNAIVLTYHESWSSVVWCARLLILYILHRSLSMWIWSTYALNCNTAAIKYSSNTFLDPKDLRNWLCEENICI